MGKASLVRVAVGFAAGSLLRLALGWSPAAWVLLPLILSSRLAPVAFAGAGMLAAEAVATPTATPNPTPTPTPTEELLDGRVESVPDRLEGRVRFLLRAADGRVLQVTAPPMAWPLAYGDRVRLRARVFHAEGPRNPGGRDQAALLAARGVSGLAAARAPPVRLSPPSPLSWLEAGRTRFAEVASAALPPPEAALVRAIAAGDRSALDPATNEAFARSGLIHLLSVSGLHLAVVAAGAWRLLRALLARSEWLAARVEPRRLAAVLAVPVAALYAAATGADVPVVRSALAAGLGFTALLLDREASALAALALALLAVLAAEPGAVLDVSLQLSFASVAGLALLTPRMRALLRLRPSPTRAGRAAEVLLTAIAAGLAATLATAPLVAFHFRRLSVLSPAANLVGVPLGSALTVVAAAAALLSPLAPGAAGVALWCCRPLAWLLLRSNELFAAPDWAVVGVASPGIGGLVAAYAGMWGSFALRGWRRWLCAALAAAGLLAPGPLRARAAAGRGLLEVAFLSVGHGDAALLRLPDGAAVLVDAGGDPRGRYDPGARDVVPFLRDAGVRRLWLAVLTHPDPDHGLGFGAVGSSLGVERFATGGREPDPDEPLAAALARMPRPSPIARGEMLERAGVRIRALGPPPDAAGWSDNDASLVLRVEYGETSFLLLADVEGRGEDALVRSGLPLAADVVKVAHHGSRTSSGAALIEAVHPRWAVLSLAAHNPFRHPSPAAVERWREAGAEVVRTDGGMVRFLSDGSRVRRAPAADALSAWRLWREGREWAAR